MTARSGALVPLTALQRAIVDLVSARGPLSAEQVRDGLAAAHPLKDSTVRTLLRRLESRGLVSHSVKGRRFLYRAEASSARVTARAVRTLIEGVWAGSSERFLTALIDEQVVAPAELERLVRKINARKLPIEPRATAAKK